MSKNSPKKKTVKVSIKKDREPPFIAPEINPSKIRIYKTCRVCMESNIELKSIYTKRNGCLIVALIAKLTNTPIIRFDGMPDEICEDCFQRVYEAYGITKLCIESDKQLKCLLEEIRRNSNQFDPDRPIADSSHKTIASEAKSADAHKQFKIDDTLLIEPLEFEIGEENEYMLDEQLGNIDENIAGMDESISRYLSDSNDQTDAATEFACCMCIKFCKTETELLAHVAEIHMPLPPREHQPGKMVECRLCLKRFTKIKNYNSHIKALYEEKKICPVCGLSFQERYLADHILGHENPDAVVRRPRSKKRPVPCKKECDQCGKKFAYNAQLTAHIRGIHFGEKPHTCTVCYKSYAFKDSLTTHMQKHSTERKYKCHMCTKAYIYRADLHAHIQRHTTFEDRNFPCPNCDLKFFTSKQLKAHSQTHNPDSVWKCDLCDKSYRQQYTLTKHKFTEHQIPIKRRKDDAIEMLLTTNPECDPQSSQDVSQSQTFEDTFVSVVMLKPNDQVYPIEVYETVDVQGEYNEELNLKP